MTEADEAAGGSKEHALRNLAHQAMSGETMGVVGMYERAALALGATLEETEAVIVDGRRTARGES